MNEKITPLQWKMPEVGDLAIIYNGLVEPYYVLILDIYEETSLFGTKTLAKVQWLHDDTVATRIGIERLRVI